MAIIAALPLATSSGLAAQSSGVSVTVSITNLRNADGIVHACMTTDEERFTRCEEVEEAYRASVPAGQASTIAFTNVMPGTYAIAVLHDENENGKVDRFLGLIPREGFGFSNDAPVRMGPPSFEDAAIEVGVTPLRQTIRMRYML